MELSLTAPVDGRVREVLVSPNAHVTAGGPILQIEPLDDASAPPRAERMRVRRRGGDARTACERLGWLVLGYDVPAADVRRIVDDLIAAPPDPEREHRLLEIYADVRALNRPHPDPGDEAEAMGSPQEHLHAFLRSLDPAAEGLPDRFVAHLERALAHYGIEGFERTAALEDAGYRLFLSQQRAASARAAVQAILTRRLEQARRRRRGPARRARPPRGDARAARAGARRAGARAALADLRPAAGRGGARGDRGRDGGAPRAP